MTSVVRAAAAVAIAGFLSIAVSAAPARHEVTFKGTVVSADVKAIKVTVVNEKTKKPEEMAFKHDGETKFLRGDKVVKFAQAAIQKGEKIAVTINHDDNPEFAVVIRLDARK